VIRDLLPPYLSPRFTDPVVIYSKAFYLVWQSYYLLLRKRAISLPAPSILNALRLADWMQALQ